jgi:hypothetical protein
MDTADRLKEKIRGMTVMKDYDKYNYLIDSKDLYHFAVEF